MEEIMKRILAAVFALSCLSAVRLPAQTLTWSTPAKYATGTEPSVSMNSSGIVVEVHKSQNYNTLYYHIGKLNRSTGTVTWGKSHYVQTSEEIRYPEVALTQNSSVIICYEGAYSLRLRYMTGTLDPTGPVDQAMTWVIKDKQYDTGIFPSMSINSSGDLVEVHENNLSANKLFYRYGYVDPNTSSPDITWKSGTNGVFYENGDTPGISINDNLDFVEVHKEARGSNLHYRTGVVDGDQLSFRDSERLPKTGSRPSVATTNFGLTIAVLNSSDSTYATAGYIDPSDPAQIDWRPAQKVQDGTYFPAVATDGDWIIAIWTRGSYANYDLQYSVARVP
jgi:hypothetical protein